MRSTRIIYWGPPCQRVFSEENEVEKGRAVVSAIETEFKEQI